MDKAEKFYLYKSIASLKVNQSAQNPITYLEAKEQSKIHPGITILQFLACSYSEY